MSFYRALTHNDTRSSSLIPDLLRAVHRLLHIAARPLRHRTVATCFRNAPLASYTARQPQLPFKYLRRHYLASTLDRSQRARVLVFHFDYLVAVFARVAVEAVAHRGVVLWSRDSARAHEIRLLLADPVDNEGELALEYHLDGRPISVLSFTFAPALLFGLPGCAVTLISRVQTLDADPALLRASAKDLFDIAPRFALIAVVQGLALALRHTAALAVSLANQTAARSSSDLLSPASYDALFASLGGRLRSDGFFHLTIPFAEAELTQASASHRRRARNRRARRQAITDQARGVAIRLLVTPLHPAADAAPLGNGEAIADAYP